MDPKPAPNPRVEVIPRQPDAQGHYIHFTGGFRAAKASDDLWGIEPVLHEGRPCRKGFMTTQSLQNLARSCGFSAIAFQHFGWIDGKYFSHWLPIMPGRTEHQLGASDLWANARSNASRERMGDVLRNLVKPTREEIGQVLDNGDKDEWLASSISLSLRNMDVSIEKICEFYNETLVNMLADGTKEDQLTGIGQENDLFAHIHAFFLHLGAARDYLGALIAHRLCLPESKDDFTRLLGVLRPEQISLDPLLLHLRDSQYITVNPKNKVEWSGWLKETSETRNQFVHKRPYGSRFAERFGIIKKVNDNFAIFKYIRNVEIHGNSQRDILDVIEYNYRIATKLFYDLASLSGMNTSIPTITDKDVISFKKRGGWPGLGETAT